MASNYEKLLHRLRDDIDDCKISQYENGLDELAHNRNIKYCEHKFNAELRSLIASIKDENLKNKVIQAFQEHDAVELRIEQYIAANLQGSIEKLLTGDWRRQLWSFALALAVGFFFYIISDKIIMSGVALIVLWYENRISTLERTLKFVDLSAKKKTAEKNCAAKKKQIRDESIFGLPEWLI